MKILFLHGWHSVVGGVKPTYLIEQGHEVVNPSLDDDDFNLALKVAQEAYDLHRPDVIVGSSRGGAVAMNIKSGSTPLVLLCPAWKRWGEARQTKPATFILHSTDDEVIPFSESEELVARSGLSSEALLEVGSDHRLADEGSLSVMLWACNVLAHGVLLPWKVNPVHVEDDSPFALRPSQDIASYLCDACGEEIVVPIDVSEGSHQSYVEDCPVCCRASVIHVSLDEQGNATVWAEPEQDNEPNS